MTTPRPVIDGDAREILLAIMLATGADLHFGDDEIFEAYIGDIEVFKKGERYIYRVGTASDLTAGTDTEPKLWAANTIASSRVAGAGGASIRFAARWPDNSVTDAILTTGVYTWLVLTEDLSRTDTITRRRGDNALENYVYVYGAQSVEGWAGATKYYRTGEDDAPIYTFVRPVPYTGEIYARLADLAISAGDVYRVISSHDNNRANADDNISAEFVGNLFQGVSTIPIGTSVLPHAVGVTANAGTAGLTYANPDHVHTLGALVEIAWDKITGKPSIPSGTSATPHAVGATANAGTRGLTYANPDHVHTLGALAEIAWDKVTGKPTIPAGTSAVPHAVGVTANAGTKGLTYANPDHVHTLGALVEIAWDKVTGKPTIPAGTSTVPHAVGTTANAGTKGATYANPDHVHTLSALITIPWSRITSKPTIPAGTSTTPHAVGATANAGTAGTTYANPNHVHSIGGTARIPWSQVTSRPTIPSGTSTTPSAVGATANAGTRGTTYANPNHIHSIGSSARIPWSQVTSRPTIPSGTSTTPSAVGTVASAGTRGLTYANPNHVHTLSSLVQIPWIRVTGKPTVPTASSSTPAAPTSSGTAGTSTTYSRGNHAHPEQTISGSSTGTYVATNTTMISSAVFDTYLANGNNRFVWIVGGTWRTSVVISNPIYAQTRGGVDASGFTGWDTGANRYRILNSVAPVQSNTGRYRLLNNITGLPVGTVMFGYKTGTHQTRILDIIYIPSTGGGGSTTGDVPAASTSTPVAVAATGTVGTSTAYARGDHRHARDHAPPLPSNANPSGVGTASSQGTATRYSRQDHVHAASSGGGATIAPYTSTPAAPTATGTAGSSANYSRGDHAHPRQSSSGTAPSASSSTPASVSNLSARTGTSTTYARGDHRHNLQGSYTSTPTANSSTGTPGTSTRWARGDHRHAQGTISVSYSNVSGAPSASSATPQAVGSTGSAGSGSSYSRGNHRHALGTISYNSLSNRPTIPTGSNATPQNVGSTGARAGISRSWSRSDHRHQTASGQQAASSTQMFWDGSFTDSRHEVPEDGLANYSLALITSKIGSKLDSTWIDVSSEGFWQSLDVAGTDRANSLQVGDFYIGRTSTNRLVIWSDDPVSYKIYVQ